MFRIDGESQLLVDKYNFEFNNKTTRTISMHAILVSELWLKVLFSQCTVYELMEYILQKLVRKVNCSYPLMKLVSRRFAKYVTPSQYHS